MYAIRSYYAQVTEHLSGCLPIKKIAAMFFPYYCTSRPQIKALHQKINENTNLAQRLSDAGFQATSTWLTPQQIALIFEAWGDVITSYSIHYTKLYDRLHIRGTT